MQIKKNKQNLSESESENEITEFQRFISIELQEETPQTKVSLSGLNI